jgi:hypothetical protein
VHEGALSACSAVRRPGLEPPDLRRRSLSLMVGSAVHWGSEADNEPSQSTRNRATRPPRPRHGGNCDPRCGDTAPHIFAVDVLQTLRPATPLRCPLVPLPVSLCLETAGPRLTGTQDEWRAPHEPLRCQPAPSGPTTSAAGIPHGVTSNTVPRSFAPPIDVVPNKFPAASRTRPA